MYGYFIIALLIVSGLSEKLPDYFNKCSRSDSNLSSCLIKNVENGLSKLTVDGDAKMQVGDLKLIKFDKWNLQASPTLNIEMSNIEIFGFETVHCTGAQLKGNALSLKAIVDKAYLIADYSLNGKILFLPIQGHGKINLTFVNVDAIYTTTLVETTISNDKYYKTSKENIEITLSRLYYDLTNLFNGDEKLGTEMNKFLNDNWKDVYNEIGITVRKIITKIIHLYINGYFSKIPINDLIAA